MQRVIQIIIALSFVSYTLAANGDVRINGGGKSGRLEFQRRGEWGAVCKHGFDDDAADVACKQLGYLRSSDVDVYDYYYDTNSIVVCDTICGGYEDKLTDCYLTFCDDYSFETCNDGVVSITCTNILPVGAIIGIVLGVLAFVGVITAIVAFCICCLVPECPMYYRRSGSSTSTVVVTQPTPPVVQMTQPAVALAYNPKTGYQPYPAVPPTTTTVKY